jgi:RNA polymerase sigma-54 factor
LNFSRHKYPELARLLGISITQVKEAARFISDNLNPFPARSHWGESNSSGNSPAIAQNVYFYPDVVINQLHNSDKSPLIVDIASPIPGSLRVNPSFKQALSEAPTEKHDEWQQHIEKANLLVKCLQQRDHTMVRLMQRISVIQRDFILHGDAYLKPLTRAQLAEELELHESTISRAVSDKAVQLLNGRIVPLDMFFDRSLHIRTALKDIIEHETVPLSDTELSKKLAQLGFPVKRRTVAKYRAMEGILSAHQRKHTLARLQV